MPLPLLAATSGAAATAGAAGVGSVASAGGPTDRDWETQA